MSVSIAAMPHPKMTRERASLYDLNLWKEKGMSEFESTFFGTDQDRNMMITRHFFLDSNYFGKLFARKIVFNFFSQH